MRNRIIAIAALLCLAFPLTASYQTRGVVDEKSLGVAVYSNPTTAKTFASTPTSGVTIPAGTVSCYIGVRNQPINYLEGATAPTTTTGMTLEPGPNGDAAVYGI